MGKYKLSRDDSAMVSIDLMVAMVIVIAAVIMAILIMPTLSHQDRDWRIMQYMTAVRVSDNLVQDTGAPGWEANWTPGNYPKVTKIGFVHVGADNNSIPKVLSENKLNALMARYIDSGTQLPWWEFPNSTTSQAVRENATRALGLAEYNFYMQLHPVGLKNFNLRPLETNLTNGSIATINEAAAAVDRYVYINNSVGTLIYNEDPTNSSIPNTVHYRLNLWVW